MNVTYKLSHEEYQQAVIMHHKSGKRPLLVAVYAGFATFIILAGTDLDNTREVITNILTAFFAISFYLLFVRMISAYQATSIYKKSPILSKEITLRISGKGIRLDKDTENSFLPWDSFSKWKKNDKLYLIYTNSRQFNVIPIRAMNDRQLKEFEEYLNKYIPQ